MVVGGVERLDLAGRILELQRVERFGLGTDQVRHRLGRDLAGRLVLRGEDVTVRRLRHEREPTHFCIDSRFH